MFLNNFQVMISFDLDLQHAFKLRPRSTYHQKYRVMKWRVAAQKERLFENGILMITSRVDIQLRNRRNYGITGWPVCKCKCHSESMYGVRMQQGHQLGWSCNRRGKYPTGWHTGSWCQHWRWLDWIKSDQYLITADCFLFGNTVHLSSLTHKKFNYWT